MALTCCRISDLIHVTWPLASAVEGPTCSALSPVLFGQPALFLRLHESGARHFAQEGQRDVVGDRECQHQSLVLAILRHIGQPGPPRGAPSSRIWPASGAYTPASIFISVLFPAPFSPTKACTTPGDRLNEAPSRATTPAKDLSMPRSSSTGPELLTGGLTAS